ncbi:hypothetical protein CH72_1847 [Burkholderia ambifaria AMMD]|uniref:Uncharacterized protein n=1 Tax=Burkholderia ambifaria (strain ATCC BAA-244 / DSM 16087 / CCUG 44356 / LMG 19182 / AMMD) TaxID=339670 RepID=Q0BBH8_BURCM|nr:DUF2917 domain-containing protein [Burkholderia ambifaria]ABI88495.1 conserved hypothetical protein [Burkholderia ambifaria AMMD]AJY23355.1 hypothetical protein CH72_1847 [Burkholderia ambifaria AMMD]MBR7931388.1 DUF2917 domain-containing protein [Burkholderia ambifaria]PEH67268.1 DUF2917 domain-containing protein [Burkholderia ambifaria]QQC04327.1 DUF2917 domain-containing protein [Burkholderia ambifaria]
MQEISSSITFEIPAGETVPMKVQRSTRLTVQCGPVWATRSNDVEDYFLVDGETLRLRRGERLWLSAESGQGAHVAFSVSRPAAEVARGVLARVRDRVNALVHDGWRTV